MLSRLLLSFLALALGLGICESLLRVLDIGPRFQVLFRERITSSRNPILRYELRPGSRDGAFQISSAGIRDREFSRLKPQGVFRIVALGDSVTYGGGTQQPEAWPRQLEWALQSRTPDSRVEVLNFGVSGYNIAQVMERLDVLALGFEPDLVLYGYVLNDPQQFSVEASALAQIAKAEGSDAPVWKRLAARSRVYLLSRHLLGIKRPGPSSTPGRILDPQRVGMRQDPLGGYFRALHKDEPGRQRVEAGLARLAGLSTSAGIQAAVILFPLLLSVEEYPLQDVHTEVRRLARSQGLRVLDLAEPFQEALPSGDLHLDFLHPTARGHRLAAREISNWICEQGWIPCIALKTRPASRR